MNLSILTTVLLAAALMSGGDTGQREAEPDSNRAAADEAPKATVRWRSRAEDRVYGYIVYRARRADGPFRRLSVEIVHVDREQPGPVREYAYVDRDVEAGATYHYYLDVIGEDGRKRRFSDVVARTVDP